MKTFKFFALVGTFSFILIFQPTIASRLEQTNLDDYQNYVVIGAFKYYRNAVRFANHAQKDIKLNARFEINPNRNLYYVYVLSTNDRAEAITEAKRLRVESEFSDTWVFNGFLGKFKPTADQQQAPQGVDINPMTEQSISGVSSQDKETVTSEPAVSASIAVTEEPAATTTEMPEPAKLDDGVEGKSFLFKLYRGVDNAVVEGDVDAIDIDRTRKIASYKGNVPVKVTDPLSKSDNVAFVCEVFGYRKVQRDMNYNTPEGEGVVVNEQGQVEVPFELVRLQKGDIAIMYNVFFFKDAAIMRPESRYEVNSLLDMLNENPKYKIKIHGHANGSAAGKIISMPKKEAYDEGDFFSLTNTEEGFGSAKALSQQRAEIIRQFLISKGIDPKRMELKAWGGKRPIHDKLSTRAAENVRVEIEILQN